MRRRELAWPAEAGETETRLGEGDRGASTVSTPRSRIVLGESEADALERINAIREGFCSRVKGGIALSKHCGIVRLPAFGTVGAKGGLVLEIVPKIWGGEVDDAEASIDRTAGAGQARVALLRMLAVANGLKLSELDVAPQSAAHASLLDLFVRSFLRTALRVAKAGLLTRYMEATDDQPVLRGRLLLVETERLIATRPGLFRCSHDDLTVDNPYNQALLAALEYCRPHARQAATQRLWFEARALYSGVSLVRTDAKRVASLKRGRETMRYAEALRWTELLLSLLAPSISAGGESAPALLFNMEQLFERWVEVHERSRASEGVVVRFHGSARQLAAVRRGPPEDRGIAATFTGDGACRSAQATGVFRLTPDILHWREEADTDVDAPEAVVDAKWKVLAPKKRDWGVDEKDVYQLLAYVTRYSCLTTRLAFPVLSTARLPIEGPPRFEVNLPNGQIATVTVDLVPIDA
ncbi:hypothetical protein LMG24235_07819 [Paraburkholderia sabiae]|nr:hypothetical protein LMG24235_07819 [Paraburkholderia sabiae]